ncbi:MAG TPA: glycosyltransferase family A protein [Verrucomicrobiae bacterium]|nr:glycosyltransferase family A protein [Verrucomicrobiae bacterium]
MSQPTVALCIPAYNAAKFLPRLLNSAAAQVISFDEIIVCDDASKDDTVAVARSFGAEVIVNSANSGCSVSKNNALNAASTDWIHFHDADDELLPNFTSLARHWAIRPDAPDVILFDYEYRDNDTGELIARSDFSDEKLRQDQLRYAILNQINPFCGLYRRARLLEVNGYDTEPEILYNEDVAFHCKLALAGFIFRAEKEVSIINYRINGSMSGANQVKCLKAHHAVMRKVAAAVGHKYPAEIASRLWAAATGLAAYQEWESADAALGDAQKLYRGVPRNQPKRFAALCRVVGPRVAFRLRERAIRLFKPRLRRKTT